MADISVPFVFHIVFACDGVTAIVPKPTKIIDGVSVHRNGSRCIAILQGQRFQRLSVILSWLIGRQKLGIELVVEPDTIEFPRVRIATLYIIEGLCSLGSGSK